MVIMSLGTAFLSSKLRGYALYWCVVLGVTVMIGLFLLDATVFNRIGLECVQYSGLDLNAELHRIIDKPVGARIMMLFNVVAFLPLGLVLSLFLSSSKQLGTKRCIKRVALATALLSLLIETLQLLFKVGLFELTDIVLNTFGAVVGAFIALGVRSMVFRRKTVN